MGRSRSPQRVLFHGGAPGLLPSQRLVPPAARPGAVVPTYALDEYDTDPRLVYLAADRRLARFFAAIWTGVTADGRMAGGGGDLYQVEPEGRVETDPDYAHATGVAVTAPAARVLRVVERRVQPSTELMIYGSRWTTWDDGARMFDHAGYAQPSALMTAIGMTAADLRHLGVLPDHRQITAAGTQWLPETSRRGRSVHRLAPGPRRGAARRRCRTGACA